jgi:hypothetical protein
MRIRDTDDTNYRGTRHRHKSWRPYMDAMFVPVALITIMAISFGVIVVLVAREVAKR